MAPRTIFLTGGTGYVGRPLISALVTRGHGVRALVRPASRDKLPQAATAVAGDALDASTFADAVAPADTLVHLVGTPHPTPAKAREFRAVDRVSVDAALAAALHAGVRHFVYVSVAHPAPVMRAYIDVRIEGEAAVRASGLVATIVRPWYVLGPGHRWPYILRPLYALAERIPATRESALRLGLVTLAQMVACLVRAVENPPQRVAIVDVPAIRALGSRLAG
jgi:uncharacterized protein YbjT (DUF2867 family)